MFIPELRDSVNDVLADLFGTNDIVQANQGDAVFIGKVDESLARLIESVLGCFHFAGRISVLDAALEVSAISDPVWEYNNYLCGR